MVFGLLPPARRLPEAIKTLPSPSSPWLLSISKTLAPCSDARTAAVKPAKPAPTMRYQRIYRSCVTSKPCKLVIIAPIKDFRSLAALGEGKGEGNLLSVALTSILSQRERR